MTTVASLLREAYGPPEEDYRPDPDSVLKGYVHEPQDFAAVLAERGAQQEPGEGRLPNQWERWQQTPWFPQDILHPKEDSHAAQAVRALGLALSGLRGGTYHSGGGSYPEPFPLLPGVEGQAAKLLQMATALAAAYANKKDRAAAPFEGYAGSQHTGYNSQNAALPPHMIAPPGRHNTQQYLNLPFGMGQVPNPRELSSRDIIGMLGAIPAVMEGLPMGWTKPAGDIADHLGRRLGHVGVESMPKDLRPFGSSKVEPLTSR